MTAPVSFQFRAAGVDGVIRSGVIKAGDQQEAIAQLVGGGLHPIHLEAEPREAGRRRPAPRRELAALFQSLHVLVSAGVPLDRALAASERAGVGRLGAIVPELRAALRQGQPLSAALEATDGLVPLSVVSTLRAGERGSQLPAALRYVALRMEAEAELLNHIRQSLAYPILLLVAGTISVGVIGIVVLPRFAVLLSDGGQALPPATRLLLNMVEFGRSYGTLFTLLIAVVIGMAVAVTRQGVGRLHWHRGLLRLPVVGPIRMALGSARVTGLLSGMLHTGVPLLAALREVGAAVGDAEMSARLERVRERVGRGEQLAAAVGGEKALAESAVQLLAVGEESGQLARMAERASIMTASEAERGLKTAVLLLEPSLVVVLGGVVAFVAAALLQAIYSLRPT